MGRNSITTQGYFVKRLRDNGFDVSRVYDRYSPDDRRKWTIAINPNQQSIFITCYDHGEWPYKGFYLIEDGGNLFPNNLYMNTMSIEVIIKYLLDFKVEQVYIDRLNNNDGRARKKAQKDAEETTS